jgi:hypothetical protein
VYDIGKTNKDLAFIIASEVKEIKNAILDLKVELCKIKS